MAETLCASVSGELKVKSLEQSMRERERVDHQAGKAKFQVSGI